MFPVEILLFVPGFYVLVKGADIMIEGASSLAKRFHVPELLIGLTVVAFGTSLPELVTTVTAALSGNPGLALGNIIGSNLANTLLILGAMAVIFPPKIRRSTVRREIPFSLLATLILFIIANDRLIDGVGGADLTRVDGLVLLSFLSVFLYSMYRALQTHRSGNDEEGLDVTHRSGKVIAVLLVGGVFGLWLGGRWVVDGAVMIARTLDISEFVISASIIALGTSLPELVTSIRAAAKRNADLAVGNIVGSNIFNILAVLGITSLIAPISIPSGVNVDLLFLLAITALFFVFTFMNKRYVFLRWQGMLFVGLYVAYMGYLFRFN